MRAPSSNPITLNFGATSSPYTVSSPHQGTDFAYLPDETVYAPFSGRVTTVRFDKQSAPRDGNAIYMIDPSGKFHGLLHLASFSVSSGQSVTEGQPLGIIGETGYAIGRHLHWAVKSNGQFIDPLTLIKEEPMLPPINEGDVKNAWRAIRKKEAGPDDISYWIGDDHKNDWKGFDYENQKFAQDNLVLKDQNVQTLPPGTYKVN